jgi:hypothetical protein
MSASDPQQDRFSAQESPPLNGRGLQITLEEWKSVRWESLKASAMYVIYEICRSDPGRVQIPSAGA